MKLRCVIVDDEPLAITVLQSKLAKIPGIEVVDTFNDALSVHEYLAERSNEIDFLFLDIEMPSLSGIDLIKSLLKPQLVVITSANKNYAVEGFDLNVVDYVVKPITLERIVKAVNKVKERIEISKIDKTPKKPEANTSLFLKENKRMVKVVLNDILYIESIKDYVKVVTRNKMVVTKQKISFFEETLPKEDFVRVHKSFIVATNHIDAYNSSFIEIGFTEIPIGRSFKEDALKRLARIIEDA